ncbi:hypothetical protein A1O3_04482 [Capronia epimyces CBS 606.96]|uniref:FAD/NAD(P)-binding domain-containing protein n=1 Tax=Capronia epimyces CBS 606.96 TaxID=1182542 RepID=W9Y3Y2_9EURO|nr:uncharacterized protein A1O3_04482 [Capronia epimyces CBS 606.96]EXJ87522.1 hypothetical protein A1O3_04482 [Capronia epimyces CBS 606.96]
MLDYVVVGAGPSGLCAAKTILECEPGANVKILDANKTLGGVWALENLYPGLKTNNLRGGIDFSDFPMHDGFGVAAGQHVTGEAMHAYLRAYAERSNLVRLIDFETHVQEIGQLPNGQGWRLKVRCARPSASVSASINQNTSNEHEIQTKKLIIATGITNRPHRPFLIGAAVFGGPIIHSAELGVKGAALMDDPEIETVTVLGGGKSAFDAVHLAGRTGHRVEWIMRKSGKGPEWIFPSHTTIGPVSVVRERLATRRILTCFSPCLWKDGLGWIRHWLHGTAAGKWLRRKFWANLHAKTLDQCGMLKDARTRVLEPETSPFWYGTASGIYSYEPDLYAMVKTGQVRVHREDISYLAKNNITLGSGQSLPTDALITATGFSTQPTLQFTPSSIHSDLGIPSASLSPQQYEFWARLDAEADLTIASKFPSLLVGPVISPGSYRATATQHYSRAMFFDTDRNKYTPFRLYRGIAPPGLTAQGDHSVVFIGMFSNLANTPRCELQCLWGYAYLNGKLHHIYSDSDRDTDTNIHSDADTNTITNTDNTNTIINSNSNSNTTVIDPVAIYRDTALMSRYAKHRAPYGHGSHFPDLVFDQLPYFDLLLQDLKLKYWRKHNLVAELFASYVSTDYAGVVQEWIKDNGSSHNATEPPSQNNEDLSTSEESQPLLQPLL